MRRVVVTGLGCVTAIGNTVEEFWSNLVTGICGIDIITLFDTTDYRTHIGAEVKNFHPEEFIPRRLLRRTSRTDQMAIIATHEAILDAGIDLSREDTDKIGVVMGGGSGGMLMAEDFYYHYLKGNRKEAKPSLLIPQPSNTATDYIGMEFGLRGPRTTITTACSSSATSIGLAYDMIRRQEADVIITGGSDAICRLTYSGFNSMRSVDKDRCRPFDASRKGLSLGEGAGILILEEMTRALMRNTRIYAEFAGYGVSCDAYHMTAPDPGGKGAARAILSAIMDSGIRIENVDYMNAHGTATQFNDLAETQAIKLVFGERAYKIPVSSIKSMVGHCLGAAGGIEAVATVLTIVNGIIPPTINYEHPDSECDLDYVPNKARKMEVNIALSNSFAFGGNNTSIVFKKYGK